MRWTSCKTTFKRASVQRDLSKWRPSIHAGNFCLKLLRSRVSSEQSRRKRQSLGGGIRSGQKRHNVANHAFVRSLSLFGMHHIIELAQKVFCWDSFTRVCRFFTITTTRTMTITVRMITTTRSIIFLTRSIAKPNHQIQSRAHASTRKAKMIVRSLQ
jgi:hypothetical protein